ncbi:MAG: ribulose-phosphate 3-epimerase [Firmicutes bacterium]|nr:ribulose-phosphate 3-epimerase [Bacillota bacterium]
MGHSNSEGNRQRWEWLRQYPIIAPSLMCADLLHIGDDVHRLEAAGADAFHVDIMDGHFVDNLALNFDILKQVRSITNLPIDVHLMVDNPEAYMERVLAAGADLCIFHMEASRFPLRAIQKVHTSGAAVGIAINPATSVEAVRLLVPQLQMVLVMTVEPGFAGQRLLGFTLDKIAELATLRAKHNLDFAIGVDGAMDIEAVSQAAKRGASFFVGGTSGIFLRDGTDFAAAMQRLREAAER